VEFKARTRSYWGRLTVTNPDGTPERPWVNLHTVDEDEAHRQVRKINADLLKRDGVTTADLMRFGPYAQGWLDARIARDVAQAPSERCWLNKYIQPLLRDLFLGDIRPAPVRHVLQGVIAAGKGRQTLVHVRNVMLGVLKQAVADELRDPLRRWWNDHDRPKDGPVFPVTRGKRKGEARLGRGVSFAERLRRGLHLAGIKRHVCEAPDVMPLPDNPCCAEFASDGLYNENVRDGAGRGGRVASSSDAPDGPCRREGPREVGDEDHEGAPDP
jgi:hypothetical protein